MSLLVGPKPDMLNSTRSSGSEKLFNYSRSISFDYVIPCTDQTTKLNLPIIEDLDSQDAFQRTKIFRDIAETMSWDAKTQRNILNVCVSLHIRESVAESPSTKFLEKLERSSTENESIVTLERKLKNIKQRNFYTIQEYKNAITETVSRISLCSTLSSNRKQYRIEETFLANLDIRTINRMMKCDKKSMNDIIICITQIENNIFENLNNRQEHYAYEGKYTNNTRAHSGNQHLKHKSQKTTEITKKWYNYHKLSSHNDSECNAQKKTEQPDAI